MAIGAILGIAQAGMGVASAIGGFNSESNAIKARNAQALKIYERQKMEWYRGIVDSHTRYRLKKNEFAEQVDYNNQAYNDMTQAGNRRLDQIRQAARFADVKDQKKLAMDVGKVMATGQSGKSTQRLRGAAMADFGRNQAIRAQNLTNEVQQQQIANKRGLRQLNKSNRDAFSNVAYAPQNPLAPVAPLLQSGPSGLALAGNIGSSLLSGVSTASSLTPSGQGINKILGI